MPMPWSMYRDQQFGYVHIRVTNATALQFLYYHNEAKDTKMPADHFWLYNYRKP